MILRRFIKRWEARGGYRDVLIIAIPLILSTGALSIQHFIDRMYLTWYSPEAIAASVPAGILNFTIVSLFIGTASYVSTFVAQYYGAKQDDKIGRVVWQGVFFSLLSIPVMLLFIPLSVPIFRLVGHETSVMDLEIRYFVIMCIGGVFPIIAAAIGGFFSGLGATRIVMWVNLSAMAVNIILDYIMIFGRFGFPEMGIDGAAWATVAAGAFSMLFFFTILFSRKYRLKYSIFKGIQFDKELLFRLVRFGFPNGVQFFLDMLGFTLFILLVGKYGKIELAATNIAFNINGLAFMPMIGFGIAVSVLVGQNLGNRNPEQAEYVTWSAAQMSLLYMTSISICYLIFPEIFLKPFGMGGNSEAFNQITEYTIVLLRFIAFYSIFDSFTIIFASAIKGAGDTRFVMKVMVALSWGVLIIPTYFAVEVFHWHLYVAWIFATAYVSILGFVFLYRFLQGKWKNMLVIELNNDQTARELPGELVSG